MWAIGQRSMHDRGACVAAVSDVYGGVYNSHGLDMRQLLRHVAETGSVVNFPGGRFVDRRRTAGTAGRRVGSAALEGQITRENAHRVRAKIVAEGANGPTTPEADAILADNGVFVIPDILCNGGGVVVSYFEWVQSLQSYFWDEGAVRRQMENTLIASLEAVNGAMTQCKCRMRMAAYMIAIERIIAAINVRGFYP